MPLIFDPSNDEHAKILMPFLATAAITRGSPVSIDSSGDVADTATATLNNVIGVAYENIASGEVGLVQTWGYCDYVVTDGNVAAPGTDQSGDLVLIAADGGVAHGATEAEITADPTLAYYIFAKNLAVDSSTTGVCFIGNAHSGGGATS